MLFKSSDKSIVPLEIADAENGMRFMLRGWRKERMDRSILNKIIQINAAK